ncbi:MAG: hypothetical protein AAF921_03165 [Cyanobacteria bacterium P01_D01_bin.44]
MMQKAPRVRLANTFQLGSPQTTATVYHIHLRTHQEIPLFGQMEGETAQLNGVGHIAADEWQQAANHYKDILLDSWVVLPDSIRALIILNDHMAKPKQAYGKARSQVKPRALTSFVAGFKAAAAKRINLVRSQPGAPVWQRGYHEQRIEDEITLIRIRQRLTRNAAEQCLGD